MPPKKEKPAKAAAVIEAPNEGHAAWYPLWSGEEQAREYYNPDDAKKSSNKDARNTKWNFEDPGGKILLPNVLGRKFVDWKRIPDLYPSPEPQASHGKDEPEPTAPQPTMVWSGREEKVLHERPIGEAERNWLRKKELAYPDKMAEPIVGLYYENEHLLGSELIRAVLSYLSELQRDPDNGGIAPIRPWELVWPQTQAEDGKITPHINPFGKYIVKLYWQGGWRKVTVDDFIPVGENDQWLLPKAPNNELWLTIVTKAIMKLACLSYERTNGRPEFGDASILQMLTGWQTQPVPIAVNGEGLAEVAKLLHTSVEATAKEEPLSIPKPKPEEEPDDTASNAGAEEAPRTPKGKSKRAGKGSSVPASDTTRGGGGGSKDGKDGKDGGSSSQGGGKDSGDGKDDADGTGSADASVPDEGKAPAERPKERRAAYVDATFVSGAAVPAECGLSPDFSEPVRVLACTYLPPVGAKDKAPNYENIACWVVKCSSNVMQYRGSLRYDDEKAWHISVQLGLELSRETLLAEEERAWAQRASKEGHEPFIWHMRLSEFCNVFNTVRVHHAVDDLQSIILEYSQEAPPPDPKGPEKGPEAVLRHVPDRVLSNVVPPAKGAEIPPNLSGGQPYFFLIDSLNPSRVIVSLSVSPKEEPRYSGDQLEPVKPAELADPDAPILATAPDGAGDDDAEQQKEPERPKIVLPTNGAVFIEEYIWNEVETGKDVLQLATNSSVSAPLDLPAGRHIFRVVLDCPHAYSLSLSSQQELTFGEEEEVLGQLDGSSVRFQEHVTTTCQALQIMFLNQDETDKVLTLVATAHFKKYGADHVRLFWESLLWALKITFGDDWLSGETTSPEATAWIRLIGDLQKRFSDEINKLVAAAAAAVAASTEDGDSDRQVSREVRKSPTIAVARSSSANGDDEQIEAAIVIQSSFRGFQARKAVEEKRHELILEERPLISESWTKISSNLLEFGVLMYRRMFDKERNLLELFNFGPDEEQRGKLLDLRGATDEQPAHKWFCLFKDVFKFQEVTECLAQLRIAAPPAAEPDAPAFDPNVFQLVVVDNDTQNAVPTTFGLPLVYTFAPNTHGYTFVGFGRSPVAVPKIDWALRCMSFPDFPVAVDQELSLLLEPVEQTKAAKPMTTPGSAAAEVSTVTGDVELKYDVLFRYTLEIEAIQEMVSICLSVDPTLLPDAVLHVELLEDGVQIAEGEAKHFVVFPLVRFKGIPRPVDPNESESVAKGGKGKKEDTKRGKSAKRSAPSREGRKSLKDGPAEATSAESTPTTMASLALEGPEPVGSKYTLIGRLLSGGTPAAPTPNSPPSKAPPAKKGKGKPKSANAGSSDFPEWTLHIVSNAPELIKCKPDHVREEQISSTKTIWEVAAKEERGEEGRAALSQTLRESYLRPDSSDEDEPSAGPNPRFLNEAELAAQQTFAPMLAESKKSSPAISKFDTVLKEQREKWREEQHRSFTSTRVTTTTRKELYGSRRSTTFATDLAKFTVLRDMRDESIATRNSMRQAYRNRILNETAMKANAAAAWTAALAAEQAALALCLEDAARPPSRKKK